jgi:hypothetical protein
MEGKYQPVRKVNLKRFNSAVGIERTLTCCANALNDAKLKITDIGKVILVGGKYTAFHW